MKKLLKNLVLVTLLVAGFAQGLVLTKANDAHVQKYENECVECKDNGIELYGAQQICAKCGTAANVYDTYGPRLFSSVKPCTHGKTNDVTYKKKHFREIRCSKCGFKTSQDLGYVYETVCE